MSHPVWGVTMPPSPCIGSIITAQVFSFIAFFIELIDISHTLEHSQFDRQYLASTKPSEKGPKPFLYSASDEKPTMVVVLP